MVCADDFELENNTVFVNTKHVLHSGYALTIVVENSNTRTAKPQSDC